MEMLHVLRNGRQKIQGGQSLDVENTTPQSQINPATGAARPISRREATPVRATPERPPLQRNPGQRPQ